VDQNDGLAAVTLWGREVGDVAGFVSSSMNAVVYPDFDSLKMAVENGKVDLITLTSLEYLEIKDSLLVPVLTGKQGPEVGVELVLLVQRDARMMSVADLREGLILIPEGQNADLSQRWLDTALLKNGLGEARRFFKSVRRMNKVSQAVLAVFFGQATGCVVGRNALRAMVDLNPQVGKELQVLLQSPRFVETLTCLRKGLDQSVGSKIINAALTLEKYPKGEQILTLFQLDTVVRFEPHFLDTVRTLDEEYRRCTGSGGN